jgi:hypothetical protein
LSSVEREGSIQASGPASAELEQRLLAHGDQIHTESGKHKTRLETWPVWAQRCACEPAGLTETGKLEIERSLLDLGGTIEWLPWRTVKQIRKPGASLRSS